MSIGSNLPSSTADPLQSAMRQELICPHSGVDNEDGDVCGSITTAEKQVFLSKPDENGDTNVFADDLDPLTLEYVNTYWDLHDRRAARRARQLRIRESIGIMQEKLLSANLERKRKLPTWLACIIRRIFVESGYIRNSTEATLVVLMLLLISAGVSYSAYTYWLSA